MTFRRCTRLLISLLGIFTSYALADLQLILDTQNLTSAQQQASQQLLNEALAVLPPRLIQRLQHQVHVRWQVELPDEVYGRASPDQLELNRRLLPALTNGSAAQQPTGRWHETVRRELLATVVHELAHLYDRERLWDAAKAGQYQQCQQRSQRLGSIGLPEACRGQNQRQFTLSDDPQFLELAGWSQQIGQRGGHSHENYHSIRSPDAYELTNPREFVAVNLEYFLLDPQYSCRRPAMNRYLSQHFEWHPPQSHCPPDYPIVNAGRDFDRSPLLRLNPDHVYEVDYLFAEADQDWVSRWGHSMLRLVICAPEHALGPQCRLDLGHHLVLSFRAFVDDVQLSSWASLIGHYPSRLFVLPLDQVVEEYTRMELRNLSSIPLRLSRAQIRQLVERSAELHWSYDGAYYFLSNNCAVETLNLLRDGSHDPALTSLDSIMPSGLLELLEARGLANRRPLTNPREALRLGYRFESYRARYEAMFQIVQQHLNIPVPQLEDWLDWEAPKRRPWISQADLPTSAALLLLEQGAYYRQLLKARDEVKRRYLDHPEQRTQTDLARADATLRALLANSGYLSRPAELLASDGYGIPQPDEWQKLAQETQTRQQHLSQLGKQLDQEIRQLLGSALQAQLQATEANLSLISQRLRTLHQAKGKGSWQLPQSTHNQSSATSNKPSQ